MRRRTSRWPRPRHSRKGQTPRHKPERALSWAVRQSTRCGLLGAGTGRLALAMTPLPQLDDLAQLLQGALDEAEGALQGQAAFHARGGVEVAAEVPYGQGRLLTVDGELPDELIVFLGV